MSEYVQLNELEGKAKELFGVMKQSNIFHPHPAKVQYEQTDTSNLVKLFADAIGRSLVGVDVAYRADQMRQAMSMLSVLQNRLDIEDLEAALALAQEEYIEDLKKSQAL